MRMIIDDNGEKSFIVGEGSKTKDIFARLFPYYSNLLWDIVSIRKRKFQK